MAILLPVAFSIKFGKFEKLQTLSKAWKADQEKNFQGKVAFSD